MQYEVATNVIPTTRGKYHLRCVSADFDPIESERLAQSSKQTFTNYATAVAQCSMINAYLEESK